MEALSKMAAIILVVIVIVFSLIFFVKYNILDIIREAIPSADEIGKETLTPEQGFNQVKELYNKCFSASKEECTCGGHFPTIKNGYIVLSKDLLTIFDIKTKKPIEPALHQKFNKVIACYIDDSLNIKERSPIENPKFISQTPALYKKGDQVCLVLEEYVKNPKAIRTITPCN